MTLAVMLLSIDSTVLSLAIPRLSADLTPSASQLLWIGDIYSFVLAGLLVTAGNIADKIGRRRLLLIGALGFGLSSLFAAFAPSAGMLIAARALLGLSGATIMPSTLSLVRNIFPDDTERTRAVAIWSAASSGGMAIGPLVGGFLLEHFWWGSVFLINIPIMVLVLGTGIWLLPESKNPDGAPIDIPSSLLSILTIVPVVYSIKTFAHDGFVWQAIVSLVIGLIAGDIFVRRQMGLDVPLLDVTLFRRPAFTSAVVATVVAVFALSGLLYFFSQYLQLVREYSTLRAGLSELPLSIASIVSVAFVGWLVGKMGRGHALSLGLAAAAGGMLGLAIAEGVSAYWSIALALIFIGAGAGIAFAISTDAVLSAVPAERAGAASAVSETSLELGAALGIALLGTLQDLGYRRALGEVEGVSVSVEEAAEQSLATLSGVVDTSDAAQAALLDAAQHAFVQAMQVTSLVAGGVLVLGAALAWFFVPSEGEPRRRT